MLRRFNWLLNKPGPAQVGAICQVFSFTVLENRKFFEKKWTEWRAKVSQCRKTERGDPLRFFNIHSVAKHEKIEENKNFDFRKKISVPKKN